MKGFACELALFSVPCVARMINAFLCVGKKGYCMLFIHIFMPYFLRWLVRFSLIKIFMLKVLTNIWGVGVMVS